MKVNGIIAEYNPFHNGHEYQLSASKEATQADYTIVAMSGNFTQRGTPAILDKYHRAEMALRGGADLILEIPSFYALGSAEYFASGAAAMLDKLGVVDCLCFGSECGDIDALYKIASILAEEPQPYKARLKSKLKQGCSYPNARSLALLEYCPSLSSAMRIFTSPNNILGIEYIKALLRRESPIAPVTIKRSGTGYNDKDLNSPKSSALAIRSAIFSQKSWSSLQEYMPAASYCIMRNTWETHQPIHANDFSLLLHYKLISEMRNGFERYADVSPELSDRIRKNIYRFDNYRGFCDLLKTKDITHTRISRCLMHILLNMEKTALEAYIAQDYVPYARVLGFRRDALPLLSAIKEHSSIPLISKLADAGKVLPDSSLKMLRKDIDISNVYNSVCAHKSGRPMRNEYSTPLVIL